MLKRISLDFFFLVEALFFGCLYVLPPISFYNASYLQNFDYGILFNSTDLISRLQSPYMTTRGVHAWADDQDYFQILLALLHYTQHPHHALIIAHSLGIFACGIVCFLFLRSHGLVALIIPAVFWLNPLMVNMNIDLIHTEAFATLFLILVYVSAVKGWSTGFYLSLILALSCKEDVALTAGFLMFLGYFAKGHLTIKRKHMIIGFCLCVAIFFINQYVVLPFYKFQTCKWLSSDFSESAIKAGPIQPWFSNIFSNLVTPSFYEPRFFIPEAYIYLALLMWPVLVVADSSFPFCFLPLVGAFINLIASGYLIKGTFHYDHSSFGAVMIALLAGTLATKHKRLIALLLLVVSIGVHLNFHEVRPRFTEIGKISFWDFAADRRVRFLEDLNRALPRDIVISADSASISYLLPGRNHVYMFENPFRGDNFGIYDVCDGKIGSLDRVPKADFVVIHSTQNVTPEIKLMLEQNLNFERLDVNLIPQDSNFLFYIYLSKNGPRYVELRQRMVSLGIG